MIPDTLLVPTVETIPVEREQSDTGGIGAERLTLVCDRVILIVSSESKPPKLIITIIDDRVTLTP